MYNFDNIKITSPQELFQYISEEDILTHYYGEWAPRVHSLCPFKKEVVPSFYPVYHNQRLKWLRFGLYNKPMDVIDFVMIKFNLSFSDALNKIYQDLVLNDIPKIPQSTLNQLRASVPDEVNMSIVIDDWQDYDIEYWESHDGFKIERLENRFKINAAREYWSYGQLMHTSSAKDPLYCYDHSLETGRSSFTAYRPYGDTPENKLLRPEKYRNLSNKFRKYMIRDHIMNFNTLIRAKQEGHISKHDVIFITSSLKDVVAFDVIGYDAVAAHSEEGIIHREVLLQLKKYYSHIYVAYNNDETGVRQSIKITNNNIDLGLKYWNVPKSFTGAKDPAEVLLHYNAKDLADSILFRFKKDAVLS